MNIELFPTLRWRGEQNYTPDLSTVDANAFAWKGFAYYASLATVVTLHTQMLAGSAVMSPLGIYLIPADEYPALLRWLETEPKIIRELRLLREGPVDEKLAMVAFVKASLRAEDELASHGLPVGSPSNGRLTRLMPADLPCFLACMNDDAVENDATLRALMGV